MLYLSENDGDEKRRERDVIKDERMMRGGERMETNVMGERFWSVGVCVYK